ncbi:MAG: antA/AntB antirepressor family protein [Patescibacteria group bacterium]
MDIQILENQIGLEKIQSVNARELHSRLGVGRDYTNWIKQRLEECMALEHKDYQVYAKFGDNQLGGRPSSEYLISVDLAKHVCMLERTELGRQMRQYFIDVEKKAREISRRPLTINDLACNAFEAYKRIGELVQLPASTIVSEASKIVDRQYGTNFVEFTKTSPLLDHVKKNEEFLEPTEIGEKLGISAIALNKKLAELGLQEKNGSSWVPTEQGKALCFVHQWTKRGKSGYNIKWNAEKICERVGNGK